uniref:CD276 antigen homolog n=1 Tax=Sparus aurata TaxID=8175 RepID=A0A671X7P5_SPAAU
MYDAGDSKANRGQDQQFKGRVSHFPDQLMNGNASIEIQNTKVTDSGIYSCIFPRLQPRQTFNIELVVGVKVVVEEDSDAVLPCLINTEDLTGKTFHWKKDGQKEVFFYEARSHSNNRLTGQDEQFIDRVSHFQDQLMNGNASIKIQNTKKADSGIYSCIFPHLQPRQTFKIELVVEQLLRDRSGEIPGAPKPIITILDATKDWALLQCVVRGASPKPKVEWQDSSGNVWETAEDHQVSERRGSFYVTLNTNVTRTDRYRCNVTQEEISHQTKAETFVFINVNPSSVSGKLCEDPSSKVVIGWLFGIVIGAVVLAAVQFGLVASKRITVTCNRGAAPEPTTTSNDLTKDTPLLQVGVTVDHQHQNGSSKAPPETPPL